MADITRTIVASGSGSAAAIAPTSLLRLMGFSVAETAVSPAAASVSLQESTSTDLTKEICAISLAAGEAKTVWFGESGTPCPGGVWVNRTAGSTRLVLHTRISDRDKDSFSPPSW